MMKKIITSIFILSVGFGFAQQDAQYTQYMYNTITINPAYAGSRGVVSIFGLHRTQWIGLDGAPKTNAFSINAPINNTNLGVGVSFINDKIGPTVENQISADVSYTIPMSDTYKLSFGIKGTANLFNLDISKLSPENQSDPTLQDLNNYFSPNLGAGVYLHSDRLYFGFSIPNFFETTRYTDNTQSVSKERMNYYFIGGYVFDLSPSLKFKPAFLAKAVEGAPLQLDLSGNFLINEKFVLGGAWRWDAAWSAMVGFQVSEQLFIGYGYDRETTNLARFNSGSHEIFVRYELFKKVERIVSPRFF
jgi:type IX secretion system PorP/SprF family membrane protein